MEHKTHTTLSEQSQSQIQRDKIDTLTHKYKTAHFPGPKIS